MQDRYYIIAIVVILAICCLGGYVAVSGYLNSNPSSLGFLTPSTSVTSVVVVVNTDTPGPVKSATPAMGAPTAAPVPSPLGAFQTIAAETTQGPPTPTGARPAALSTATSAAAPATASCAGFAFCPKGGPPDYVLGVGGDPCRANYIWGRVTDKNGNGLPSITIRYKLISTGDVTDAQTKSPPDPAGVYNFPAPPGSVWQVWVMASGNQASPQVKVTAQAYGGAGNCPTRVDFVQQ